MSAINPDQLPHPERDLDDDAYRNAAFRYTGDDAEREAAIADQPARMPRSASRTPPRRRAPHAGTPRPA